MRLLVLGGTAFLGRHLVEAALERGHEVTLFTRGQTNPGLFPHVERLLGDRTGELSALEGREFEVVIDTSGYLPRVVRASAELLAAVGGGLPVRLEHLRLQDARCSPRRRLSRSRPTRTARTSARDYGALKALCEQAVQTALPGRALVIRPGLVVGPHDYTGRFSYWPRRVAEGGEVLAPGSPEARVWLDRRPRPRRVDDPDGRGARDRRVQRGRAGGALTFGGLLEECRAITGSDARFTWVGRRVPAGARGYAVQRAATLAPRRRRRLPGDRLHAGRAPRASPSTDRATRSAPCSAMPASTRLRPVRLGCPRPSCRARPGTRAQPARRLARSAWCLRPRSLRFGMSEAALLVLITRYPDRTALARRGREALFPALRRLEADGLVTCCHGLYRLTRHARSELELRRLLLRAA